MTLERFREVAQEKTAHIEMTPVMRSRMLEVVAAAPRRKNHRAAWTAVAACLVLMAVSAAGLMTEGFGFFADKPEHGVSAPDLMTHAAPNLMSDARPDAGGDEPSRRVLVSKSAAENIVPAQGENGLWGYQNEVSGAWVVGPIYKSAEPVDEENACAWVELENGTHELLLIESAD